MFVDMHLSLSFDCALERDAVESIAQAAEPLFQSTAAGNRIGLCVASPNAGAATSMKFWADAQHAGLAVASPELFPWCLANASCGALARRFKVRGPNYTYLGDADAVLSALEAADDGFDRQALEAVVLVVLRFASNSSEAGELFGVRLICEPRPVAIRLGTTRDRPDTMSLMQAVNAFQAALSRVPVEQPQPMLLTDGYRLARIEVQRH